MSTKRKKSGRLTAEEEVMGAVRKLGFRSFGSYVASRSTLALKEMAAELTIPISTFLNYHARWARENAPPPLKEG